MDKEYYERERVKYPPRAAGTYYLRKASRRKRLKAQSENRAVCTTLVDHEQVHCVDNDNFTPFSLRCPGHHILEDDYIRYGSRFHS